MFSFNEEHLIKILGNKRMTISKLVDKFYTDDLPFEANNKIASMINRIEAKCFHHNLGWTIASEGTGRAGKTVWKVVNR